MQIIELRGNREAKIRTRNCTLCVPAIHAVTGERRVVAQILHSTAAVRARAISPAEPGHADASTGRKSLSRDHLAHDLVARNYLSMKSYKLTFHDMQIGAAHTASHNA
jgi:hypothetical protein